MQKDFKSARVYLVTVGVDGQVGGIATCPQRKVGKACRQLQHAGMYVRMFTKESTARDFLNRAYRDEILNWR